MVFSIQLMTQRPSETTREHNGTHRHTSKNQNLALEIANQWFSNTNGPTKVPKVKFSKSTSDLRVSKQT